MNRVAHLLCYPLVLFAVLQPTANAQQVRPGVRPGRPSPGINVAAATRPTFVNSVPIAELSVIIPELDVQANTVKLKDFLPILQQKVPDFQFITEPGPWEDLMLPELHLRNVTMGQIFGLIGRLNQDFPIDSVTSRERPPLYIFGRTQRGSQLDSRVQGFYLSTIADRLMRQSGQLNQDQYQKTRKEMLNHVLSLIETTVEESASPSGSRGQISFHPETETVLVKGSQNQINAVSQTLSQFQLTNTLQ
jgi:hypothetical protein